MMDPGVNAIKNALFVTHASHKGIVTFARSDICAKRHLREVRGKGTKLGEGERH